MIAAAGRLGGRWLLIDTAVKGEGRGLFAGVAGGREPWHWIDQSFRYAHHLRRQRDSTQ